MMGIVYLVSCRYNTSKQATCVSLSYSLSPSGSDRWNVPFADKAARTDQHQIQFYFSGK